MVDVLNAEMERENTVVLSSTLDVCDVLDCVQVTLAKLEMLSPAVTLYRFVDGEEVTLFELNGFEMNKLIEVCAGKHIPSVVTATLERSKHRVQQAPSSVCPDLVASDILVELVKAFSKAYCSEEVQESRKKSA